MPDTTSPAELIYEDARLHGLVADTAWHSLPWSTRDSWRRVVEGFQIPVDGAATPLLERAKRAIESAKSSIDSASWELDDIESDLDAIINPKPVRKTA